MIQDLFHLEKSFLIATNCKKKDIKSRAKMSFAITKKGENNLRY